MALDLRLQQKMTQQLVMTPQLQQAIKLLQLNHLEMAEVLREEIEQNPVLEEGAGGEQEGSDAPSEAAPADDGSPELLAPEAQDTTDGGGNDGEGITADVAAPDIDIAGPADGSGEMADGPGSELAADM